MRIPVFSGPRCIELAGMARAQRILQAPNAIATRSKKGKFKGQVIRIDLTEFSDDSRLIIHRGNPRRYSHDRETQDNPARCWTLRHLPIASGPIFRNVVTSCLKEAA